jgi:hypothetical protein
MDEKIIKEYLYKGVIVYCFDNPGKCPNCGKKLEKNEFDNFECSHCWYQSIFNHDNYIRELIQKYG